MTCSARSFSSVRRSFSSAMSSSSVAPRQRVPAMGCVVTTPSSTVTSASGLEPTMSKRSPAADSSRSRYMYGLGLVARSTR